ncbi:MAG: hypothetical protein ABSA52_15860 [Candidatus Binatia bacterium]|jgi:outer membrane biosynthesis protein TonB
MSRVVLMKMAIKACVLGVLAVLAAGAIVAEASQNSATFQAPEQATETETPTETPAPTDTPAPTASDTPTATPSDTPTPPATATASPTMTGTLPTATPPPAPNIPFLFAASGSQSENQWACAFNLASSLGLDAAAQTFQKISDSDAAALRNLYKVIYVAPGLNSEDYGFLQQMVTLSGTIEQFVSSGGVAVINAAGALGNQPNIAPDGVGFSATAHDSETIEANAISHPYITGVGFGGDALGAADFDGWQSTDLGTLTGWPEDATIVLTNGDGPSWVEYRHGDGRVIVTTLTYCTSSEPNSQGAAARNLLLYSSFFKGSAFTPAPTVTLGPRLTPTKTPSLSPTASATPTATLTPVPSPSASPTSIAPTPTPTALPTTTPTFSPGSTTTPTDTVTPTASQAPSETATCTTTATTTSSATPTEALTATATELASATPTQPPTPTPTATAVTVACAGDCNKDHVVTIDELLVIVQIALGNDDITTCDQSDANGDGRVTVDEILMAVSNALNGCPSGAPRT